MTDHTYVIKDKEFNFIKEFDTYDEADWWMKNMIYGSVFFLKILVKIKKYSEARGTRTRNGVGGTHYIFRKDKDTLNETMVYFIN